MALRNILGAGSGAVAQAAPAPAQMAPQMGQMAPQMVPQIPGTRLPVAWESDGKKVLGKG